MVKIGMMLKPILLSFSKEIGLTKTIKLKIISLSFNESI